jgi:transposase
LRFIANELQKEYIERMYPQKFREQVLRIKQAEELTHEQAAKRFGIAIACIARWARRIKPKEKRNKPATKINMEALAKDVEKNPDVPQYKRAIRFGVTPRGIGKALKRLGITYKKNPSGTRRLTLLPGKPLKKK